MTKVALILVNTIIKLILGYVFAKLNGKRENLYLLGADYGDYSDDSLALAKYINDQGYKSFHVSNNPQDKTKEIRRGSFQSFVVFFQCRAVYYSHSLSDVIPFGHLCWPIFQILRRPHKIFIQHGVIGLKTNISSSKTLGSYVLAQSKSFDKMVVSSEWEKNLVAEMGVGREKIFITGLARFDRIIPHIDSNQILVFFTWRKKEKKKSNAYCVEDDRTVLFKNSKGCRNLIELGYIVKFMEHAMHSKNNDKSKNPYRSQNNVQLEVNKSSLLITDNSSIAWDFLYKGSDVIFFKPTYDGYVYELPGFGERIANDVNQLDILITKFLEGKKLSDVINVNHFIRYSDKNNCKRILDLSSDLN